MKVMVAHFPYWIIHGNGDVGKDEQMDEEGRRGGFAKPIRTVSEGEGLRQAMKIFIGHQFKRPENKKGKQLSKIKVIKVLLKNLKFEQIFPHV